jgi:hypothetical protein
LRPEMLCALRCSMLSESFLCLSAKTTAASTKASLYVDCSTGCLPG